MSYLNFIYIHTLLEGKQSSRRSKPYFHYKKIVSICVWGFTTPAVERHCKQTILEYSFKDALKQKLRRTKLIPMTFFTNILLKRTDTPLLELIQVISLHSPAYLWKKLCDGHRLDKSFPAVISKFKRTCNIWTFSQVYVRRSVKLQT